MHGKRYVAQSPELARTGAALAPGEQILEAAPCAPVATETNAGITTRMTTCSDSVTA